MTGQAHHGKLTAGTDEMAANPDKLWKEAQRAKARADWPSAIKYLNLLIKLAPKDPKFRHLVGICQRNAGNPRAAADALDAALALAPADPGLNFDAAMLARETGQVERALVLLQNTINAGGGIGITANIERSRLLMSLGRSREAAASLDELLAKPGLSVADSAEAAVLRALLALSMGDLARGWQLYGQRFRAPASMASLARHDFGLPPIQGQIPGTEKIWVWPEQGVGDEILFASVLADAGKAGWRIKLGCYRRNLSLFRRSFTDLGPNLEIVAVEGLTAADLTDCGRQMPLADLVAVLRPDLAAFGTPHAYLRPDAEAVAAIRARYDAAWPGKRRIGISWRSSSAGPKQKKAVALAALARTVAAPDRVLIDLQYGDTAAERAALLRDHGLALYRDTAIDPLGDSDPAAAQMAALDAVITISNTAAHIAGAIGAPGLVLLPADDGLLWYWLREGQTPLWYPRLRLLRQQTPGDWSPVLAALPDQLSNIIV